MKLWPLQDPKQLLLAFGTLVLNSQLKSPSGPCSGLALHGQSPHCRKGAEQPGVTSMGFTVMVRAESSQSISFSLPVSWSLMVLWCAARIRNTPRMIMNTRKLTHTTITTVAVLGTTAPHNNRATLTLCQQLLPSTARGWLHTRISCVLLFNISGISHFVHSHIKSQQESKNETSIPKI